MSDSVALTGEVLIDEPQEDYRFFVNLKRMTWGDNMIQIRFQLLMETVSDLENTDMDKLDETERKTVRAAKVAAMREVLDGFDEMTAYLNRVARITLNGKWVSAKDVPMDFIQDVMKAIGEASSRRNNPKN